MSTCEVKIGTIESDFILIGMSPIPFKVPDSVDKNRDFVITGDRHSKWLDYKRFVKDGYLFVDYTAICDFVGQNLVVRAYTKPKPSETLTLDDALAMCEIMRINRNYSTVDAYKHIMKGNCIEFIPSWAEDVRRAIDEKD